MLHHPWATWGQRHPGRGRWSHCLWRPKRVTSAASPLLDDHPAAALLVVVGWGKGWQQPSGSVSWSPGSCNHLSSEDFWRPHALIGADQDNIVTLEVINYIINQDYQSCLEAQAVLSLLGYLWKHLEETSMCGWSNTSKNSEATRRISRRSLTTDGRYDITYQAILVSIF